MSGKVWLMTVVVGMFSPLVALGAGTGVETLSELPVSARASGMGNAFGGIADDVNAFHWNPAGLIQLPMWQVGGIYTRWIAGMSYGAVDGVLPFKAIPALDIPGTVGLHFLNLSAGADIPEADVNITVPVGEDLSAGEMDIGLSYAYSLMDDKIAVGTNFKMLKNTLGEYKASGMAIDLGVIVFVPELLSLERLERLYETGKFSTFWEILYLLSGLEKLNVGLSLQNFIATKLEYMEEKESVAGNYMFSVGAEPIEGLSIGFDLNLPSGANPRINLGAEYWLKKLAGIPIAFRGGYIYTKDNSASKTLGLTAGLGVRFKGMGIDYALMPSSLLGTTHYISLVFARPGE